MKDDDELGVFEAATGADAGAWLARVVAGAADGPTAFDPFSSRKAHVLKQAKQFLAVHKSDCRDASQHGRVLAEKGLSEDRLTG